MCIWRGAKGDYITTCWNIYLQYPLMPNPQVTQIFMTLEKTMSKIELYSYECLFLLKYIKNAPK